MQRDFRRHLIGKPQIGRDGVILCSDEEIAKADVEIDQTGTGLRPGGGDFKLTTQV